MIRADVANLNEDLHAFHAGGGIVVELVDLAGDGARLFAAHYLPHANLKRAVGRDIAERIGIAAADAEFAR